MTMSWLAEQKATMTANRAVHHNSVTGFVDPSASSASAKQAWVTSAQPRRRPHRRVTTGRRSRSISGAQANFSAYGRVTSENRPMASLLTPPSRSQNDSVDPVSASGRPSEKPRNRMARTRRSR